MHYPGLRVERHLPEVSRANEASGAGGASGGGAGGAGQGPSARQWFWEEIELDSAHPEVGFRIYLKGNINEHWTDPAPEDEVIIIDEVLVE